MPIYPLGICRSCDVANAPHYEGMPTMQWSYKGDLACAYIDGPLDAIQPMLHAAILDAIYRRICVLPLRFGTKLQQESEIGELLEHHHEELLKHISYLNNTCEMDLRILPQHRQQQNALCQCEEPTEDCDNSPLGYIKQRRKRYELADESAERNRLIVDGLLNQLQGHYKHHRQLPASHWHPIRLAFLIERHDTFDFQQCVEKIRTTSSDRYTILGPWPPYSFV